MKKPGLLKQMNLYLLTTVAITLLITIAIISVRTSQGAKFKAIELAGLKARKVASDVRIHLNKIVQMNKNVAVTLQTLQQNSMLSREDVAPILENLLINNSNVYAVWTMWEPNAFDGKDKEYALKNNQIYGRFACSSYRSNNAIESQNFGTKEKPVYLSTDLLYEYEEDYYKLVKLFKADIIVPPYYYSFTNDSINQRYMTTMASPILINDKFAGVIGTDIDLIELQSNILQSVIYQSGFAAVISNNLHVVAHPNTTSINQSVEKLFKEASDSISSVVKNGNSYFYQTKSEITGERVIRYFYPVNITDVQVQWATMVEIPMKEVYTEVSGLVRQVIVVGLVGILLISFVIYLIVRGITRPILKSVKIAQNISCGKLKESHELSSSTAELVELGLAFQTLAEKLKMMQQASAMGYWEMDFASLSMQWSDGFYVLLGMEPQEFIPDLNTLLKHVHEDHREKLKELFLDNHYQEEYPEYRFKCYRKDKTVFHVLIRYKTVTNKKGMIERKVGVIVDISELTQNEQQLLESEEKFRNIFECSNDAILIVDENGNFIDANEVAFKRSGLSRDQFLRYNYNDWIGEDNEKNFEDYKKAIKAGIDARFETSYINTYGKKIYIEINGQNMMYKGQQCYVLVSRDVSERKVTEKQIVQAIVQTEEKERGRLARELHDGVSPILSAVKLYGNAIRDSKEVDFRQKITEKLTGAIDEAIQGISDIANNLTPHVLQNFGLVTAVDIFIKHIEEMSSIDFQLNINLEKRLKNDVEVTLYRIITELINNTIKYSGANTVTLEIKMEDSIALHYTDNGCGFNIDEVKLNKRGMGLFNLTNRVHSFDGHMLIESKIGHGIKVDVEIPN